MSLKSSSLNPGLNPTKAAIVQAATKVFAQAGIKGATTKEIACQAGVHETTLFRHFENKQALLKEVIRQLSLEMTAALDQTPHEWTENLYQDLLFYARVYQQALIQHNDFIRMLVGEGNRHAEFLQEITQSSNLPFREHLLAYLEQARLLGQIRATLQPEILANILTGIIFAGALRSCLPPGDGLTDNYLQQCLNVFIQGIENNP
jgi:AcrR family transcriptional regulator